MYCGFEGGDVAGKRSFGVVGKCGKGSRRLFDGGGIIGLYGKSGIGWCAGCQKVGSCENSAMQDGLGDGRAIRSSIVETRIETARVNGC